MSELTHYHLVCGEILFKVEDGPTNAVRLNTVIQTPTTKIAVTHLGKAQQGLQLQFHKKLATPGIDIVDVTIFNISYLGQFTPEEFHEIPAGMAQQEVNRAEPSH